MNESKTHWKNNFDYTYLGGYSIEDEDLELTISKVQNEMVKGQSGRDESCMVIYFEELDKGMICNKTNAKTITTVHGTPYIEEWKGKLIQVYVESGVKAFGDVVDALRIRDFIPQDAGMDVEPAMASLRKCGTLDELKSVYTGFSRGLQGHKEVLKLKEEIKTILS